MVQEQQKKTEKVCFLSGSVVHHSFPGPLGEVSSNKQGHNPFLGAAQWVLGAPVLPAVVRAHRMLQVHLAGESLGAPAFCYTSRKKMILKITFARPILVFFQPR